MSKIFLLFFFSHYTSEIRSGFNPLFSYYFPFYFLLGRTATVYIVLLLQKLCVLASFVLPEERMGETCTMVAPGTCYYTVGRYFCSIYMVHTCF